MGNKPGLDTIQGLLREFRARRQVLRPTDFIQTTYYWHPSPDAIALCSKCGQSRRMQIAFIYPPKLERDIVDAKTLKDIPGRALPALFNYRCTQCDTTIFAILYRRVNNLELLLLPTVNGGLRTEHTPDGVSYYLDQAHRALSAGANSAAVAMFRGALEQILFEQGYTDGTCGKKLKDLERAIEQGNGPKWAISLPTVLLRTIKQLGDGAVHPNDGDIKRQHKLDRQLISHLNAAFNYLLELVYEQDARQTAMLKALREGEAELNS